MAFLLLVAAVSMVQNPDWWIRQLEEVLKHLDALDAELPTRWQRPRQGGWRTRVGMINHRRTREAMRWMGVLLALLASANLYELALQMLAR